MESRPASIRDLITKEMQRLDLIGGPTTSSPEKILRILELTMGRDVLENMTVEERGYHVPYWTQAIVKNPKKNLRIDTISDTLYPVEKDKVIPLSGIHNVVDTVISGFSDRLLWSFFVSNLSEIQRLFLDKKDEAVATLQTTNLQIISNHASWLNLPLIAHCLHRFWGIRKEDIYILLGPALTTQSLGYAGAVRHANLIKTFPDTKNAETGFSGTGKIRVAALRKILEIFGTGLGKVLLIAPSGTTDEYVQDTGEFRLARPSPGSMGMIETLTKRGVKSMIIGSNDRDIFPGNNRLRLMRRAEIRLSSVSDDPHHWENLPKYVVDASRRQNATWGDR